MSANSRQSQWRQWLVWVAVAVPVIYLFSREGTVELVTLAAVLAIWLVVYLVIRCWWHLMTIEEAERAKTQSTDVVITNGAGGVGRWKRVLLTDVLIAILIVYLYQQARRLGYSEYDVQMYLGLLALCVGFAGLFTKPDESYAHLIGYDTRGVRLLHAVVWLLAGSVLVVLTLYGRHWAL